MYVNLKFSINKFFYWVTFFARNKNKKLQLKKFPQLRLHANAIWLCSINFFISHIKLTALGINQKFCQANDTLLCIDDLVLHAHVLSVYKLNALTSSSLLAACLHGN